MSDDLKQDGSDQEVDEELEATGTFARFLAAELADYTPVRGSIAIRPYGYAIWENIQS